MIITVGDLKQGLNKYDDKDQVYLLTKNSIFYKKIEEADTRILINAEKRCTESLVILIESNFHFLKVQRLSREGVAPSGTVVLVRHVIPFKAKCHTLLGYF